MDQGRLPDRLTSYEVGLVLRRAAELDACVETAAGIDGFDPAVVEEAAREVGLSAAAVRQALAELHMGALDDQGLRSVSLGGPTVVRESRVVSDAPDEVHDTIARFLRRQTFQLRRRQGQRAVYRPRRDLVAKLRRVVDVAGTLQLQGVSAVVVDVSSMAEPPAVGGEQHNSIAGVPADDEMIDSASDEHAPTMVRLEADVSGLRRRLLTGATTSGVAVGGATSMAGLLLGEVALLIAAPPIGIAIAGGTLALGGRRCQRRCQELSESLAALLDRLGNPGQGQVEPGRRGDLT
jgi:hypothetical protein